MGKSMKMVERGGRVELGGGENVETVTREAISRLQPPLPAYTPSRYIPSTNFQILTDQDGIQKDTEVMATPLTLPSKHLSCPNCSTTNFV